MDTFSSKNNIAIKFDTFSKVPNKVIYFYQYLYIKSGLCNLNI